MASTPVTRASLIARAAQRANTSGYADASAGGEISGLVDLSLAKVHNLLVSLYEDYFTSRWLIALINNHDTYALPTNFFKIRQVFYENQSTYRWPLRRMNLADMNNIPMTNYYMNLPVGYALVGSNLQVYPKPSVSAGSPIKLLVYYITQYEPPTSDSTPIDFQVAFGWDEWVVNDVVYQIRTKAMMPADDVLRERMELERKMISQAKHRDASGPARVRNTGWDGVVPYGPWGQFAFKP